MSILQLKDVQYVYRNKYQSVEALKGVTHSFEQGRSYALIGKSGSGKTTLLSLLAGIELPTKGEVIYDGVSTGDMDLTHYRRDKVAVIYQSFRLFPLLTVLENVMYPMELHKVKPKQAKERAQEYILSVGLKSTVFNRFPNMLSGGEQQRIAVARALAADTRLILADEPTGNLDVENSNKIIDILTGLASTKNYCVIVVTHDMKIIDKTNVVINMQDGRLLSKTTVSSV